MSNLSDIYDKVRAALSALLPDKTEIAFPYSLEDNNETLLRDGWGVLIGDTIESTSATMPDYTVTSRIEVVLTRRVFATSSNVEPLIDATKAIIDDLSTIENDFTTTPHSTSTRFNNSDKITSVSVASISQIENIRSNKYNHISKRITFEITHWK